MLYSAEFAVFPVINAEHIYALCGHNVKYLSVKHVGSSSGQEALKLKFNNIRKMVGLDGR